MVLFRIATLGLTIHLPGHLITHRSLALLLTCTLTASACATTPTLNPAETFVDAFYSFEPEPLRASLNTSAAETERVLYYQAWAKAANYQVQKRRPCTLQQSTYICRITVTDDFGQTMGYTATDTFTLTLASGHIVSLNFEGDDPPIFAELFDWIQTNRPEVMTGPCLNLFNGGTTPGACARAVVDSARQFVQVRTPHNNK